MADGELLFDAYLWSESAHKNSIPPNKVGRVPKGTKIKILDVITGRENDSKIALKERASLVGIHGALPAGQEGHVTTGKIKVNGDDHLAQLGIQKPSTNGLGRAVVTAWGTDDAYLVEINSAVAACETIDEIVDLYVRKEKSAKKWKMAAQGFSGLQVVSGVSAIGLGIAATIATGGAAAPLLTAFGINSVVSAASTGVAGAARGTMARRMEKTAHRVRDGGIATGSTAYSAGRLATDAVTAGAAGVGGGVYAAATGKKALDEIGAVNPETVWGYVDWPPIIEVLKVDLEKLQQEKKCAPRLSKEFDAAVQIVSDTLDKIPEDKIANS